MDLGSLLENNLIRHLQVIYSESITTQKLPFSNSEARTQISSHLLEARGLPCSSLPPRRPPPARSSCTHALPSRTHHVFAPRPSPQAVAELPRPAAEPARCGHASQTRRGPARRDGGCGSAYGGPGRELGDPGRRWKQTRSSLAPSSSRRRFRAVVAARRRSGAAHSLRCRLQSWWWARATGTMQRGGTRIFALRVVSDSK